MGVDFVGADDLLNLLGDGDDYGDEYGDDVGQGLIVPQLVAQQRRLAQRPTTASPLTQQIIASITQIAAQVKNLRRVQHANRVELDSKAGRLPQIFLGVSTQGVTIAAGASLNIPAETNTRLRVTDFFVDDAIAADFVIQDIQISRLSLFAGNLRIPASCFVTSVQRPPLEAPVLPSGTELSVNVTNRSGAARAFDSMFTGLDVSRTFDVTKS
jgi:hypothetical protein